MATQNRAQAAQTSQLSQKKRPRHRPTKSVTRSKRKEPISGEQNKAIGSGESGIPRSRSFSDSTEYPRWSIPLNNLILLDWAQRLHLTHEDIVATDDRHVLLAEQEFEVETLAPAASRIAPLHLLPEHEYFRVPIIEQGQQPRYLLVRIQEQFDEHWPYIVVSGPNEDVFAHLHILGGHTDQMYLKIIGDERIEIPHIVAVAEAVLSPTSVHIMGEPKDQPDAPLDEELLESIDTLAIAQSSCPEAAEGFGAAHNKFLKYVQKHYGLENIPIALKQTPFDPTLGHNAVGTSSNPDLDDDVIVGIQRDGYRRDQKIVREANVIVNKRDVARAPEPQSSQSDKPDNSLLCCIDNLNPMIGRSSGKAEEDLQSLRSCLLGHLHQKYGWEILPVVLHTTQFDEKQGHNRAGTAYLSQVGDGVIVAVEGNGYTCDDKVVRKAQVIVNRIPSHIARLNKLVPLRHNQMYLEIVARQDMIIDEVIHDAANQVGAVDVIYSLLTIFAVASPARIRYLAEQLSTASSSLIRENLGRTPPLSLRYLRRTPEIYVALTGVAELLGVLRQILIYEATRRGGTNYYLQADRSWLTDLLRQLRSAGPSNDDYTAFANDISKRLEQITFTPEFVRNTS
jgi:molecular chaperone GrpE (heat shock protein)